MSFLYHTFDPVGYIITMMLVPPREELGDVATALGTDGRDSQPGATCAIGFANYYPSTFVYHMNRAPFRGIHRWSDVFIYLFRCKKKIRHVSGQLGVKKGQ